MSIPLYQKEYSGEVKSEKGGNCGIAGHSDVAGDGDASPSSSLAEHKNPDV